MRLKVITVATQENYGLRMLCESLRRVEMDYVVLGLGETWQGFGMKVIKTREYLQTLEGYTHFIFVDAYDTLFLKPITDYEGGIIFSTEKNCWPDYNAPYPESKAVFRYLNSGCYIAPIDEYLSLTDQFPINYSDDDQRYFTNIYLKTDRIKLDTDCKFFQSYAFTDHNDLTIKTSSIINNHSGSEPAVIHFNGKCLDPKIYSMIQYNTLAEVKQLWKDDADTAKQLHEGFVERVNATDKLNEHRTFVEQNIFGFGERSFHWLWWLIVQELPKNFTFLEIGVLKGQTLSLVRMLADIQKKKTTRYGVTPLSNEGGVWDSDYEKDIEFIHDRFGLAKDYKILKGLSQDPAIIEQAGKLKLDVLYIDGAHYKEAVDSDFKHYAPLVKSGGFLVVDDAANRLQMPFGYFQGIADVSNSLAEWEQTDIGKEFEFQFNIVHNMVYKRK